ncbi:MAG: beta-ketoacyl synthase N-terminal-like domain-containing protein, partial [Phenylobacterium sp.]
MRRVVVTGIGLITPLGQGREHVWKRLLAGESGLGNITTFDATDYACRVAGEVPRVDGRGGGGPDIAGSFDPAQPRSAKDRRRVADSIRSGSAAPDEAVKDAGWTPEDEESRERTGVMMGSGIGGLATIEATSVELHEKGPRRVSPFFIPSAL